MEKLRAWRSRFRQPAPKSANSGKKAWQAVALGILLVIVVLRLLFVWVQPEEVKERNEFITTVAQLIGGFALLSGLIFTFQTVRSAQETLDLQREGQVADRFSRAVEQLESTNASVRIGGLISIERIAMDSPRDSIPAWTVVLSFIRSQRLRSHVIERGGISNDNDVQIALEVVGRLGKIIPVHERRSTPNLNDTVLTDSQLSGGDYSKLWFARSSFQRSTFVGSNLAGIIAYQTTFDNATFAMAPLQFATFRSASLKGTTLFYPSVDMRSFASEMDEKAATELREEVAFFGGNASNLGAQDLDGGRILNGLDLKDTDLTGADLRFADLRLVQNLTQDQVNSAHTGEHTILPDYLSKAVHS